MSHFPPRRFAPFSAFLLGALLLTSSPAPTRAAEVFRSYDVATLTAPELKMGQRNLVSAVVPEEGPLTIEQIKAAPERDWKYGAVKVNSLGETIVVSRGIPQWYKPHFNWALSWDEYGLDEFRDNKIEFEANKAILSGGYDHATFVKTFAEPFKHAPDGGYEKAKATVTELLNEKDAALHLWTTPQFYFYNSEGQYLGRTQIQKGTPTFTAKTVEVRYGKDSKAAPRAIGTDNWNPTPALIQPSVALKTEDAARPVKLAQNGV